VLHRRRRSSARFLVEEIEGDRGEER
jgi:hypothetical protein